MRLRVLLPSQVYADEPEVLRIVAQTSAGSTGVLWHRLDCVAVLAPGILTYESSAGGEVFVALDQGVLVKTGAEVRVSARRAIGGTSLERLREAIAQEFAQIDAQERALRSVMAQMDSGFLHRFVALTDD